MFLRIILPLLPLALLTALPFFLKQGDSLTAEGGKSETGWSPGAGRGGGGKEAAETLVIVSPHTEPIKYEFGRAFRDYYRKLYGAEITLDWRNLGGSSDIVRYINDRFEASFRQYFESLGGNWSAKAAEAFRNPGLDGENPEADPEAVAIRKQFLSSDAGIGMDLFFGGGTFDQARFAAMGYAVDAEVAKRHPEYLHPDVIPSEFAGESIYDPAGRFYGVCLSSFGIAFNTDRLEDLGIEIRSWKDLARPELYQSTVIADPTKSGSITKCFEMILQQAMAESYAGTSVLPEEKEEGEAPEQERKLERGWEEGFFRIKLIAANARYATDSAGKLVRDVSSGSAAAGMCIDFYGLSEAEWVEAHAPVQRIVYRMPENGSAVSADPIQLLRGAPNPRAARAFIDFVLSPEGQKLWILKPGTPGGPVKYALRRPCVRRDLLEDKDLEAYRTDPSYNPYRAAGMFRYRGEWTGRHFTLMRVLIKTIILDPMDELREAWRAVLENGGPEQNPEAMAELRKLPFAYSEAEEAGKKLRVSPEHSVADVAAVRREWMNSARAQYRRAARLAKEGKKPRGAQEKK